MESFPDLLLWVWAAYQTFSETLVPRLTHGGTRSISLPRWYIKTYLKCKTLSKNCHFSVWSVKYTWVT